MNEAIWADGDAGVSVGPLPGISGPAGEWTLVFRVWFHTCPFGYYGGWCMDFNGMGAGDCSPTNFFQYNAFVIGQVRHFQHFQIIYRDDVAFGCGTGQDSSQRVTLTFQ